MDGGGGRSFFPDESEGRGEAFFKVEMKVLEEDFSNSIAWSLISLNKPFSEIYNFFRLF